MRLICILLLSLVITSCDKPRSSTEVDDLKDIASVIDTMIQKRVDSTQIAGAVVGVFKGDEKVFLKSYGYADLEFDTKMPVDASFEIGSVTKQFTASALLQLVEQGKVNLDDDFTKYVKFDTHGKHITVRQLLNHTSGIKGYTEIPEFGDIMVKKLNRDTLLRIVEKKDFDFNPGEALIYNNTGFYIAGLVIEKASGEKYEDYIAKNLFEKAGMKHSYYCSESKITKSRAHGYDGSPNGLRRAGYIDHQWPFAAGSICSTVEDLAKWNQALHHGKILSEAMYKEFLSPAKLANGATTHYAKGITVRIRNGKTMLEHGGGIPGFLSENRYFPEDDMSIIVLTNSTTASPDLIAQTITDHVFGKLEEKKIRFGGDLASMSGVYKGRGRGQDLTLTIDHNDTTLTAHFDTGKPERLFFSADSMWVGEVGQLEFFKQSGTIDEVGVDDIYGYFLLKKEPH